MSIRLLRGDCRETLAGLEPGSIQACITSPPYWGLRAYGTPDLVWGGEADAEHVHEWGGLIRSPWANDVPGPSANHPKNGDASHCTPKVSGAFCPCGAWLGSLGLEPTPELFVEHIVECFRAVRRVLRDDGTLWVNMGDSYAGSGKGAKAKDLLEIPSMVAQALRADGWYLRSRIPWVKRNAMPESVTDRPATSVEYVFLLSKSSRYYWDADAVRAPNTDRTIRAGAYDAEGHRGYPDNRTITAADLHVQELTGNMRPGRGMSINPNGRNRRNGDWFFESWQGLLMDEQDAPLALVVNPAPLKIAHYASFPPKLVEPMVKASSRAGDVILDPFAGAGTTLMVADRLGRNAIGCELSESYSDMGTARVIGDAPMFVELGA